jgi:hypothetical protein
MESQSLQKWSFEMTNKQHFAALRAHRTMAVALHGRTINEVARAGLQTAIAQYDALLVDAPAPAAKPRSAPVDRKLAAKKAWRTMLLRQVKGTRGNARKTLLAKIEHYDQLLAA